jgi:hypothetical protein
VVGGPIDRAIGGLGFTTTTITIALGAAVVASSERAVVIVVKAVGAAVIGRRAGGERGMRRRGPGRGMRRRGLEAGFELRGWGISQDDARSAVEEIIRQRAHRMMVVGDGVRPSSKDSRAVWADEAAFTEVELVGVRTTILVAFSKVEVIEACSLRGVEQYAAEPLACVSAQAQSLVRWGAHCRGQLGERELDEGRILNEHRDSCQDSNITCVLDEHPGGVLLIDVHVGALMDKIPDRFREASSSALRFNCR